MRNRKCCHKCRKNRFQATRQNAPKNAPKNARRRRRKQKFTKRVLWYRVWCLFPPFCLIFRACSIYFRRIPCKSVCLPSGRKLFGEFPLPSVHFLAHSAGSPETYFSCISDSISYFFIDVRLCQGRPLHSCGVAWQGFGAAAASSDHVGGGSLLRPCGG